MSEIRFDINILTKDTTFTYIIIIKLKNIFL